MNLACFRRSTHRFAIVAGLALLASTARSQEFVRSPGVEQAQATVVVDSPLTAPDPIDPTPKMVDAFTVADPKASDAKTIELLPFEEKLCQSKDDQGWTPRFKFKPGDEHLLQMETENKLMKFYVGGRLQIDGAWTSTTQRAQFGPNGIGRLDDAVNFRRARYDFGGTFYENVDFLMEWDFINTANAIGNNGEVLPINTPVPTDMWVTFKKIPFIGNLRIGNQKPPISFEHLTSSRYLNFLERSLAFDAFIENQNNGFEPGIQAFDTFFDQRLYGAVGVFKNTRNIFGWNTGDGEYDVTARIAYLPYYEDEGRHLIHVGVAASHADLDEHIARYRARLLIRNGPAVTHNILAQSQFIGSSRDLVVPEFVMVWGPWTFASEYYAAWTHDTTTPITPVAARQNRGTTYYQGGYVEALYFLTEGDYRAYDRNRFAFTRVTPRRNWTGFGGGCDECESGPGAWQIGARYDWINLNSQGVNGSIVHDWTLGLNWFLNPYMKVQWNYMLSYRSATDNKSLIQAFGTRIALDF